MEIAQYQIVLVNLDSTLGNEIKKTRSCVIISPDEMNAHLRTIIVAPITTNSRQYPTRIEVKHDEKQSWIVIEQIRTMDKQRIIKTFGSLSIKEIKAVKSVLRETFVD